MKLISCHDGKLHALEAGDGDGSGVGWAGPADKAFRTGLAALDALPPGGAFARGAVHELLAAPADGPPLFFAALLARAAAGEDKTVRDKGTRGQGDKEREGNGRDKGTRGQGDKEREGDGNATLGSPGPLVPLSPCHLVSPLVSPSSSPIIWSDPRGEIYPPALAALGIPPERLVLLQPPGEAEELWALAECLRSRGVAAVVAALPTRRGRRQRLSRVEARRLQLAAERGGGVGLLLRDAGAGAEGSASAAAGDEHAAVTRWLVRPEPGERHVQRWRIQLIFGHGGRVGQSILLEHDHRDHRPDHAEPLPAPRVAARPVHPAAELADRPAVPAAGRAAG